MSVKGLTHKELETFIKTKVPALKWFDKDKGQIENISNHVFPMPAIFFSFGNTPYETENNKVQKGNALLRFRIVYENYADSFIGSVNQDKALAFFDFNEDIFKAFQGLSTTHLRNLNRVSDEDDLNHKNVIVTVMEFSALLIDDSAEETKTFTLVEPDPAINVEYRKQLTKPVVENNDYLLPNDDYAPF